MCGGGGEGGGATAPLPCTHMHRFAQRRGMCAASLVQRGKTSDRGNDDEKGRGGRGGGGGGEEGGGGNKCR